MAAAALGAITVFSAQPDFILFTDKIKGHMNTKFGGVIVGCDVLWTHR
jgi:hypothetical protein